MSVEWFPLSKIQDVLDKVKTFEWSWTKNSRCKYINVRIDMRDGHCYITDREGKEIKLEELQYQYSSKKGK